MNITLDSLSQLFITYGIKMLLALLILIAGRYIARLASRLVKGVLLKRKVDQTIVNFIGNLVHITLLIAIGIAAIGQVGIQTASFVAVIGTAGLAIGFALQGTLANLASGVMLILFKPFKNGDFIEGGGAIGTVESIDLFVTKVLTADNKLIYVPNTKVAGDNITNHSAKDQRRLDLVFGVSYTDNLDRVRKVIKKVLEAEKRLLESPEPTIGVLALADSSINLAVRPWIKTTDYWPVFFDLQENIKKAFDAEGISIPFPQRDVHMHQAAR